MHLVYPENFAFCFQCLLDIAVIPREMLSESVEFHNDIIIHWLDFEVAQNLDDTAPKKFGKFGTCINEHQLFNKITLAFSCCLVQQGI